MIVTMMRADYDRLPFIHITIQRTYEYRFLFSVDTSIRLLLQFYT